MNLNWKQIMSTVEGDDRFYMDTEEDEVTPKEAGWEFLRMFGKDDDEGEEEEEESVYSEASEQEESVSSCITIVLHDIGEKAYQSNTFEPTLHSLKRNRRKPTSTLRMMMNLISMLMMILRSRAWIGKTWSEKQLEKIARRRETATTLVPEGPRGSVVVRRNERDPLGIR